MTLRCWLFGHDMETVTHDCIGLELDGLELNTYPAEQTVVKCSRVGCPERTTTVEPRND